jgi:hypothetical protein
MFGYLTGRHLGRASNITALGDTADAITMAEPIHVAPLRTRLVQQTGGGDLPTAILAKAIYT